MKYSATGQHGKEERKYEEDKPSFRKKEQGIFENQDSPKFKASPFVDSSQTYNLDSRGISSRYSTSNYAPSRTDSIERKYLNLKEDNAGQNLGYSNGTVRSPNAKEGY